MMLFTIAERLHQPVFVVEQMSFEELSGWIAYFTIRSREQKK